MWEWIKKTLGDHPVRSVSLMGLLSLSQFVINLIRAMQDGVIDDQELHNLLTGANGVEALVLGAIAVALKLKSK